MKEWYSIRIYKLATLSKMCSLQQPIFQILTNYLQHLNEMCYIRGNNLRNSNNFKIVYLFWLCRLLEDAASSPLPGRKGFLHQQERMHFIRELLWTVRIERARHPKGSVGCTYVTQSRDTGPHGKLTCRAVMFASYVRKHTFFPNRLTCEFVSGKAFLFSR